MSKLLFISELGNNVSYSYVTITLREILMSRFDCYFFCIRNLGKDNCTNKLVNEGFDESRLFYIDESLLNKSSDTEYIQNVADGIYQLEEMIDNIDPNIIISLGDTELVKHQGLMLQYLKYTGVFIPYLAIDTGNPSKSWFSYNKTYMLTVSEYSKNELIKNNIIEANRVDSLPHIIDQSLFFSYSKEEKINLRRNILGDKYVNSYIVGSINCNSLRKKWDILLKSFALFAQQNQNAVLVIKTNIKNINTHNTIYSGYDLSVILNEISNEYNIDKKRLIVIDEHIPKNELVKIYNLFDLFLTTTSGEGWGLTNIEAALCKVPIIMPYNTSMIEIFGDKQNNPSFFECYKYTTTIARGNNYIDVKNNRINNLFNCLCIIKRNYIETNIEYISNLINITNIPTITISNYEKLEIDDVEIINNFNTYNDAINYIKNNDMPYMFQIIVSLDFSILSECVDTIETNSFFKEKNINKILHIDKLLIERSYDTNKNSYVEIGDENEIFEKMKLFLENEEIRNKSIDYNYNCVNNKYLYNNINHKFNSIMNRFIKQI